MGILGWLICLPFCSAFSQKIKIMPHYLDDISCIAIPEFIAKTTTDHHHI
jgi:hypothetical protein